MNESSFNNIRVSEKQLLVISIFIWINIHELE